MSDDQFRSGGFGLFRDLRRSKERVRGGGGCSDEGGSEEREDYFQRVREEEHYYVVLLHAEFLKTGGDFTGRGANVGIGEYLAGRAVDQTWFSGELRDVSEDVVVEWEVVRDINIRQF